MWKFSVSTGCAVRPSISLAAPPFSLPSTAVENQILTSSEESIYYHAELPGVRIDPIEVDPQYSHIFSKIDEEVTDSLKDHPLVGQFGFTNVFWEAKEKILKDKYSVKWRSPVEMNPWSFFD